jgi:hemin uptake protein HemP
MNARFAPVAPAVQPGPAPARRPNLPPARPEHDARALTEGGVEARILLDGTAYVLRITRLGKLILTK